MINLVNGKVSIAGANIGDKISLKLTTGQFKSGVFLDRNSFGIELKNLSLNNNPVTFYPWTNIVSITKGPE